MDWMTDTEFETHIIERATPGSEGTSLSFEDGYGFYLPAPHPPVAPGSVARLYGRGFGASVRGVVIDGQVAYYRTPQEDQAHWQAQFEASRRQQREAYERGLRRDELRLRKLPAAVRRRYRRFQRLGTDFYTVAPYELFCLEQASRIAGALKTEARLNRLLAHKGREDELLRRDVPGFSSDHSGNTYSFSILMARLLLRGDWKNVLACPGAMAPLSGREPYLGPLPPEPPAAAPLTMPAQPSALDGLASV